MKTIQSYSILAVLALCATTSADDKKETKTLSIERLKALEGTWVKAGEDGKATDEVVSKFHLIANGSTIIESEFPGTAHEMVSIYHQDGKDLVMTHYCAVGNQPKFKAVTGKKPNTIVWEFAGGTNLDYKKDQHVHKIVMTFVSKDRLQTVVDFWNKGKVEHSMKFDLVRKKN